MPLNHTSKYSELTDNQFMLIGKIVIEFSNIEFLMKNLLTRLLMTSDFLGRTYTDNLNASRVQGSIENALDIHLNRYNGRIVDDLKVKEIKDINIRITKIRGERNKFAHYLWARWDDERIFGSGLSGKLNKPNKPDKDSKVITVSDLTALYKTAFDIVEDLSKIIQSLTKVEEQDLLKKFKST